MKLKSNLTILATSMLMLAPAISTSLTSVNAATVSSTSGQISTRNMVISPTKGTVTITAANGRVYNDSFALVQGLTFKYQSSWKTDKIAYDTVTGNEYFRVAPNKWVNSYDVVFS